MLKSYGWGGGGGWWGGGLCDYCVSPSPFGLDFGTLDFGTGLDNKDDHFVLLCFVVSHYKSII